MRRQFIAVIVAGGVLLAAQVALAVISHRTPDVLEFIFLSLLAFAAYLFACAMPAPDRRTLFVIAAFGVAFRIAAACGAPLFEDDFHRYLWDAKVWAKGFNPYFYPPDDEFLRPLRDANWKGVNFKYIPTIYPPLAQAVFRISYEIGGNSLHVLRGILIAFDLGTAALLFLLLKKLDVPVRHLIVYAWNPLVVKEVANSAHVDIVAVFFVVLFCLLLVSGRRFLAAVALGAAILTKLYPLIFLPALIRRFRVRDFAVCLAVVAAGYFPFRHAEELLFEGLTTYARHWEFNDSAFVLLAAVFGTAGAKQVAAMLLLAAGLFFGIRDRVTLRPMFFLTGLLLVVAPTVDVWYLLWIIPLLALFPSPAWIALTGTSVFAYLFFWQGRDLWWIRILEYAPFYLLLLLRQYNERLPRSFRQ